LAEPSAAGDAGAEAVGVDEQVGGHESAVAVAADADSVGVGHAVLDRPMIRGKTDCSALLARRS